MNLKQKSTYYLKIIPISMYSRLQVSRAVLAETP